MKLIVQKGKTSFLACIFIQDSSSTVGAGLSGLAFNTSGLVCYRARADDGNAGGIAVTLATATLGTWATGGFKEKDATNMKGVYEIGITNASLATGSDYCILYFSGATNMAPLVLEIQLVAFDPDDAVRAGLTALPNAAANAAGGLPISAAGALDLDEMNVDIEAIQTSTAGLTYTVANQVDCNPLSWRSGAIPAVNVTGVPKVDVFDWLGVGAPANTGDAFARLGAPVGASISADIAEIEGETDLIVASTSGLTFTVANQVDVNVVDWKGAAAPAMTGDAFARLGAPVGASISADIAEVEGETDAIIATLGTPAGVSVSADIAAVPTANANADALLDRANGIETGWTPRQAYRIMFSAMAGKADGLATATCHYRDQADTKNRITATVDANGNRTAVTLDAS